MVHAGTKDTEHGVEVSIRTLRKKKEARKCETFVE